MTVIFLPIEMLRRVNAHITAFYAQNILHAVLCVAAISTTPKTRSFVDFDEK
jgi:hypothetical protein